MTCVDGASIDVAIEPAGDVTAAICSNSGSSEQPLPSTGPDHAPSIAVIGAALFAGGLALVRLARFRHQRVDSPL